MKRIIAALVTGLLLMQAVLAQETEFGYQIILESRGEYNKTDEDSRLNPGNRINIQEVSSLTQLYPIFNFKHTQSKLASLLQVEGNFASYNFQGDSLKFTFQELYTQFAVNDRHFVTVGKRRLDWGSGMLWNPMNFYIQKDPFRTQNRLEGIFQASYSLLLPGGMLQAYVFPEKRLRDFSYALKYDYYGNRIDASLQFLQYTRYQQFGFSLSYGGDISTLYAEGVLRNYSKSYRPDENGVLIVPESNRKKFFTEVVAGFSVNFNAQLSLRGEYRLREDYLDKQQIGYFKQGAAGSLAIYDPISIGKHTLFANVEWKDLYDRYAFQLRAFADPVSEQLIVSPLFIWKYHNFQVEVSGMIFNNALPVLDYQGTVLLSYHF